MMCCHFGESARKNFALLVRTGFAAVAKAPCKHGLWLVARQARKNFAPLVHTDFAAVAKAPCKHGLWLVAREKKEPSVSGRLKNFYANKDACTTMYTRYVHLQLRSFA